MKTSILALFALTLVVSAAPAAAQTFRRDWDATPAPPETLPPEIAAQVQEPPVVTYDLSGPRIGMTLLPDGTARSLFGFHFEKSSRASMNGPQFIVEQIVLLGGIEDDVFMPSGTLIFGMRLPNSFEFGVGPSITLGGGSAIVAAIGQSFRFGGIRMPVNLALSFDREGNERLSLVSGWAIRDKVTVK